MDTKTFHSEEVAELLGTNTEQLRNWRRLKPPHPKHLPATLVDGRYQYSAADILDWLNRPENVAYKELVIASFAPDGIRDWFERHRRHQQQIQTTQPGSPSHP